MTTAKNELGPLLKKRKEKKRKHRMVNNEVKICDKTKL
jgi:hypothetical protein